MKKSDRERRTDASTCKMMPLGFIPGPYEILIGRGRRCTTHWGNQRFRNMIDNELEGYAAADCKRHKSSIIGRVLADIKKHSPHAGFIKKDVATGRWLSFTDAASRVAIAQAFRDAVGAYKSSKQSKQVKRRMDKSHVPNTFSGESHGFRFDRFSREEQQEAPMPALTPQEEQKDDFSNMMDISSMDMSMLEITSTRGRVEQFDELALFDSFETLPISAPARNTQEQQQQDMGNDEFAALFQAFARNSMDMEDNPYEPLPLAQHSFSSLSGEDMLSAPMSPMRAVSRSRPRADLKKQAPNTSSTPFGSALPPRSVRAAMSA